MGDNDDEDDNGDDNETYNDYYDCDGEPDGSVSRIPDPTLRFRCTEVREVEQE